MVGQVRVAKQAAQDGLYGNPFQPAVELLVAGSKGQRADFPLPIIASLVQERVELVGGKFNLDSTPGEGTRLVVEIPMNINGEKP